MVYTILNNISEISYSRNIEDGNNNKVNFNIICNIGIEKFEIKYEACEKINDTVSNIIRKNNVEFLELNEDNKVINIKFNEIWKKIFKYNLCTELF